MRFTLVAPVVHFHLSFSADKPDANWRPEGLHHEHVGMAGSRQSGQRCALTEKMRAEGLVPQPMGASKLASGPVPACTLCSIQLRVPWESHEEKCGAPPATRGRSNIKLLLGLTARVISTYLFCTEA